MTARAAGRIRKPVEDWCTELLLGSVRGLFIESVIHQPVHLIDGFTFGAQGKGLRVSRRDPDVTTQSLERSAINAGLDDFGLGVLAWFGLDDVGMGRAPGLEVLIGVSFEIGLGGCKPRHMASQPDAYTGHHAAVRIPLSKV